jgi:hypothetical protein
VTDEHFHAWTQATDEPSGEWDEPVRYPIALDTAADAIFFAEGMVRRGIEYGGGAVELHEVDTPASLPGGVKVYCGTNLYGVQIRLWAMPCREDKSNCSYT